MKLRGWGYLLYFLALGLTARAWEKFGVDGVADEVEDEGDCGEDRDGSIPLTVG